MFVYEGVYWVLMLISVVGYRGCCYCVVVVVVCFFGCCFGCYYRGCFGCFCG